MGEAEPTSSIARPEPEVVEVLRAADISPERCGADRARQLTPAERDLYRWILRRFADGKAPTAQQTRTQAKSLKLDPLRVLASLARKDLIHADEHGAILVAYPFSARPRGHQVLIDGTQKVEAMCAIDALGIAPMLGLPVEVTSRDPVSRGNVRVQLDPGDGVRWEPDEAVVLAGNACCGGPSFRGCCDVLNFFESKQNVEHYLRDHVEVAGYAISIPKASEVGRAVFGELLTEHRPR